jgi:sulfoxide reductase heme-binding subunit YedZ
VSLWYVNRAAGLVTLTLLTASVVLGIVVALRARSERWPRFAVADLHRNLGLLALVFGVVHVAAAVIDDFVTLSWADALIPFGAAYKPVWVGVGAIGSDLMLAVLITSGLRRRMGYKAWRSVHYLSYGAWASGLLHSIFIGTDSRAAWVVGLLAGCAGAVGALGLMRYRDAQNRLVSRPRARAISPDRRMQTGS